MRIGSHTGKFRPGSAVPETNLLAPRRWRWSSAVEYQSSLVPGTGSLRTTLQRWSPFAETRRWTTRPSQTLDSTVT